MWRCDLPENPNHLRFKLRASGFRTSTSLLLSSNSHTPRLQFRLYHLRYAMPQSTYRDAFEAYTSRPSRRVQHRRTISSSVSDDEYSDADDNLPESSSMESVKSDDIDVVSLDPQHHIPNRKGSRSRDQRSSCHISDADGSDQNKTTFWPSLDLSVVVALVSPIGSWLTGGDHIKNLIVVVLLVFYLHQIIESMSFTLFFKFSTEWRI